MFLTAPLVVLPVVCFLGRAFLWCFGLFFLFLGLVAIAIFAVHQRPGTEQSGSDWTQGMMRRRLGWKGSTATPTTYLHQRIFVCLGRVYLVYLVSYIQHMYIPTRV